MNFLAGEVPVAALRLWTDPEAQEAGLAQEKTGGSECEDPKKETNSDNI